VTKLAGWVLNRKKRRMPCQLLVGQRAHTGLVLDLSPSGLFIQTNAKTRRGERLALTLSATGTEPMEIVVEVVRTKVVPPRLLTVAQGGIGVRIANAPEAYYQFLTELGIAERFVTAAEASEESESELAPGPDADAGPRFRVRVSQTSGPRSRRLEISAPDAETACTRALEELGDGWKVLGVESL